MAVTTENMRAAGAQMPRDEALFKTVFYEHYTRIYGVLYRLTGDRGQAEDLAQETFWRLWERRPARAENAGGWLYRVALHLGYNALRAAKRRRQYEEQAGQAAAENDPPLDPPQAAERAEAQAHVRRILERMAPREAQLLILRHSGLAYKEIAQALGVSANSVGTLLARAEREFEKMYEEEG